MMEETIQACLRDSSPSTGDDLLGFEIDLQYQLEKTELFDRVIITQTSDPMCALRAKCVLADTAGDIGAAVERVTKAWTEWICYPFFYALDIDRGHRAVNIRFVTTSGRGPEALCVSGEIQIGDEEESISSTRDAPPN